MDFDELNRILEIVRAHELTEFELERDDFKIRIRKNAPGQTPAVQSTVSTGVAEPGPAPAQPLAASGGTLEPLPGNEALDLAILKSPIVGTFYRSSEPAAASFAEVGMHVNKGQVLCIIEAMKLMNEINCDVDGEVVKIYVENGESVQYGERLFAIKPDHV
jgi:acetyl-CoA carboxylase biotin carboxyl carrier protein